jgi:hypothetical protein
LYTRLGLLLAVALSSSCLLDLVPTPAVGSSECSEAARHIHDCCPPVSTGRIRCYTMGTGANQMPLEFTPSQSSCVSNLLCQSIVSSIEQGGFSCGVEWAKYSKVSCDPSRRELHNRAKRFDSIDD